MCETPLLEVFITVCETPLLGVYSTVCETPLLEVYSTVCEAPLLGIYNTVCEAPLLEVYIELQCAKRLRWKFTLDDHTMRPFDAFYLGFVLDCALCHFPFYKVQFNSSPFWPCMYAFSHFSQLRVSSLGLEC